MTTDAEAIAAKLTEAQRRAILGAESDGELGNLFIRTRFRDCGVSAKGLHALGLTTIVWSGLMLNQLGLAVRQLLERNPQS
jgi:hypothetical protein